MIQTKGLRQVIFSIGEPFWQASQFLTHGRIGTLRPAVRLRPGAFKTFRQY